jgi:hypothetical protein
MTVQTPAPPSSEGGLFTVLDPATAPTSGRHRRVVTVLRLVRIGLVLALGLTGGLGVVATVMQAAAVDHIESRVQPLTTQAATVYRALAAADATAISELVGGGVAANTLRQQVDDDLAAAATGLSAAAGLAEDDGTRTAIATLSQQLADYTALIELARSNYRQELPVGASYLRDASDLMQGSMLPLAESLLQRQARLLEDAKPGPATLVVSGAALLAAGAAVLVLGWLQVWCARRFRRSWNPGLLVATAVMVLGATGCVTAWSTSAAHLERAQASSAAISNALVPGQIAALQARAADGLALLTLDGDRREEEYRARILRLARDEGRAGALGAARRLVVSPDAAAALRTAADTASAYDRAHARIRQASADGDYAETLRLAFSTAARDGDSAANAFIRLDTALTQAVDAEHASFAADIVRAGRWRGGLGWVSALLALTALGATLLGLHPRIKEFR